MDQIIHLKWTSPKIGLVGISLDERPGHTARRTATHQPAGSGRGNVPEAMYRRIADDLRHKIESGELGHGAQLPTELELRELYEASRNTVRDAVKWLITRGLVETRPGQGTFVVEMIEAFLGQ